MSMNVTRYHDTDYSKLLPIDIINIGELWALGYTEGYIAETLGLDYYDVRDYYAHLQSGLEKGTDE